MSFAARRLRMNGNGVLAVNGEMNGEATGDVIGDTEADPDAQPTETASDGVQNGDDDSNATDSTATVDAEDAGQEDT